MTSSAKIVSGGPAGVGLRQRVTQYVGLLLLPLLTFILFRFAFYYEFVMERDTPCCFFLFGREFLSEFSGHPGGLIYWVGHFLGQFAHTTWQGPLAVAAGMSLFGGMLHLMLARRGCQFYFVGTFVPCLLLLLLHTLSLRVMADAVGLAVVCAVFCGYLWLPAGPMRKGYAVILTPVVYVVAGGYVWLFVVWVTLTEWVDTKLLSGLVFKILYPLFALGMVFVAWRWFFAISLESAFGVNGFNVLVDAGTHRRTMIVFGFVMLMVPFWPLLVRVADRFLLNRPNGSDIRGIALGACMCVVVSVGFFLVIDRYNPKAEALADYVQMYDAQDWDGILVRAGEERSRHQLVQFFVNRALAEKGRLLDEMFHYSQGWGTRGLVFRRPQAKVSYSALADDTIFAMYNSDLFFAVGHVAMAYRAAYDQTTKVGLSCRAFKRMAECHMINGNYPAARKYLVLLEKTVPFRGFARHYKGILSDRGQADEYFAEARARKPTIGFFMAMGEWIPFQEIVISVPPNRMALEYLIAWRLLDKAAINSLTENIGQLRAVGYSRLPIHLQEALLLREGATHEATDLQGFIFNPGVRTRFFITMQQMSSPTTTHMAQGGSYLSYFFGNNLPAFTDASVYQRVGNELLAAGSVNSAIVHLQQALRFQPSNKDIQSDLARAKTFDADAEKGVLPK